LKKTPRRDASAFFLQKAQSFFAGISMESAKKIAAFPLPFPQPSGQPDGIPVATSLSR
jgi:hypothetical protein